ncbi:hypothetical protein vseg_001328 [Gypsophila vaccaria]
MAITTSSLPPTNYNRFHPLNNNNHHHHLTKFATVRTLSRPFVILVHSSSSACSVTLVLGHQDEQQQQQEQEQQQQHQQLVALADEPIINGLVDNNRELNELVVSLLRDPNPMTQQLGVECYEKAKGKAGALGFRPHRTVFKSLLRHLVRYKKWDLISVVCRDMAVYRAAPEGAFCGTVVRDCIKERRFKSADMLLRSLEFDKEACGFACVAAMRSYNKLHMYRVSVGLYEWMESSEVLLDCRGYVLVMEAFLKLGDFVKVVEMFDELEGNGKIEGLENVVEVYGVLVEALGKLGQGFKALERFERMREKGIPSSASIYTALIGSLAGMREIGIVEILVGEAESEGMIKDPGLFLKLVIMYVEEGLLERTLDVVGIMKGANLKVSDCIFCAIVNGFAKKRGIKAASKVYYELISLGCVPGQVTYASIINIFFRLGMFSKAKSVFDEMQLRGFDRCVVAYSTMIVMYGKTGRLRDAMKLLAKMKERGCEPNVWVYNTLIDVHGRANNLRQVDKLWKEMKRRKMKHDRVSYTSIIGAYSKAKEYEACIEFYEEYRVNGGKIDLAMAGIMVGIFSKINRIEDLVKILKNLKDEGTKLDARLYRSALNAMRDAGLQFQVKWLQENFGNCISDSLVVENDARHKKRSIV